MTATSTDNQSVDPDFFDDLLARGLVHDTTDVAALRERLAAGPVTVYVGFDPTADSLHVGNLVGLLTLHRFQEAGHRPISLAGGATGMVGDPSGKSDERNLLDDEALAANLAGIVPQLRQFLDFERPGNPAKLLDNRAWTVGKPYLVFLRDVGKHVTVNAMIAKESVKNRMEGEQGISYTEFSYMLLQAHDFFWLYENEGCEMQLGGSDQWGNITLGIDLIRRKSQKSAMGLTWPLLTRADGSKYGKTAGGETLWLGADRLSPYRFYQSWIQVEDAELPKLLKMLTFLSLAEIDELVVAHNAEPHLRRGQRTLASELTTIVHGVEAATAAEEASAAMFGGAVSGLGLATLHMLANEVPHHQTSRAVLDDETNLVPLLVEAGAAASKSEALRLLNQNGVSINDTKADGATAVTHSDLLHGHFAILRRGKKQVFLISFE